MILTNRLFERQESFREAKNIYIFCEGAKREYDYFKYFREIDSRINVEIYELESNEDNSPFGLLQIAIKSIIISEENPNPKYKFQKNDEVWIVFDTDKDKLDSRAPQILKVKEFCNRNNAWFLAQSNPCFEVWLYYHKFDSMLNFKGNDTCLTWKKLVNDSFSGGFDSRRHPVYIKNAIINAEKNFKVNNENMPDIGSTEVYNLSKNIYKILSEKIEQVLLNYETEL